RSVVNFRIRLCGATSRRTRRERTMFEVYVLPVVEKYARRRLGSNDELVAIALVLAWYYWQKADKELPASVWARVAVRAALSGRDLPGVQSSHLPDVWDHLDRWEGGGMGEVRDRRPGPDALAASKEEFRKVYATLTPDQKKMLNLVREG